MLQAVSIGGGGAALVYAKLNSADKSAVIGLGANALAAGNTTASNGTARADTSFLTGKYYFEATCLCIFNGNYFGLANASQVLTNYLGQTNDGVGCYTDGRIFLNAATLATLGTWQTAGSWVQVAADATARRLWARANGTGNWNNDAGADPAAGTNGLDISAVTGAWFPTICLPTSANAIAVNLGSFTFNGTVPTGFSSGLLA